MVYTKYKRNGDRAVVWWWAEIGGEDERGIKGNKGGNNRYRAEAEVT